MKERIATFALYAIGFAIAWGLLWVWKTYGWGKVPGHEMNPTFRSETFGLYAKLDSEPGSFEYDDIVGYEVLDMVEGGREQFIGRVMGKPGDRVRIEKGTVFRNDSQVAEAYVNPSLKTEETRPEIHVPRGCVYLLYDNRKSKFRIQGAGTLPMDSRGLGPIQIHSITHKY